MESSVRVHSYGRPPTRLEHDNAARASSLSTLAGLLAPAHRTVPLERAFDLPKAGPSEHIQQRVLTLPAILSPPGIAQWARDNPYAPAPVSKPESGLRCVRAFEHWTRRGRVREQEAQHAEKRGGKRTTRGTLAREDESVQPNGAGSPSKRRAPAAGGAPASPLRRSQRNKDIAEPPHPDKSVALPHPSPLQAPKHKPTPQVGRPLLAENAILRCIPKLYRQEELEGRKPSRRPEHESKIRFSFVDASPPPSATAALSKTRTKQNDKGKAVLNPPSSHPAHNSTRSFPIALSFLAPGRRGAWILPISGALPYPQAAIPIWDPPPALPLKRRDPRQSKIYWSDERLTELYARIGKYHKGGRLGPVHAVCGFAQAEGNPEHAFPDHIRVRANGEFALAVRATLQVFKVSEAAGSDTVKFLDHANLVWVDERGHPIFIA